MFKFRTAPERWEKKKPPHWAVPSQESQNGRLVCRTEGEAPCAEKLTAGKPEKTIPAHRGKACHWLGKE